MVIRNERQWIRAFEKAKRNTKDYSLDFDGVDNYIYSSEDDDLEFIPGGINKMETKSRYQAFAELEDKKRSLIMQKEKLKDKLEVMQRELKEIQRELEDKEEEIKSYEDRMEEKKLMIDELIKSTNESLERMEKLMNK